VDSGGNDHNREDKEVINKAETSNETKVVSNRADNPQDPADNVSKGKAGNNNDHKEIKVVAINNGQTIPTEISKDLTILIEINKDRTTPIRVRAVINKVNYFQNSYL
jgi:hypothetical protein